MTPLTDEELGALLTDTFTAHEQLADPDRAVALARGPRPARSPRGPVLLAAAASVVLVAAGAYAVSQQGDGGPGLSAPPTSSAPPNPSAGPIRAARVTRSDAVAAAKRTIARIAVYPGARPATVNDVPELKGPSMSSSPAGYTVTRSRWWTVPGATPAAVAHWYAAHPTSGFVSDGGVGSMSSTGGPTIEFVDFHRAHQQIVTPTGVRILLETTTTRAGVGIRAIVDSVWSPARAAASFAQDVTSIDVTRTATRFGRHVHASRHTWTITRPGAVAAVVRAFNRLEGSPPLVQHCPMLVSQVDYRVVFHSPSGDLVADANPGPCAAAVQVSRNGTDLPPALADPAALVRVLQKTR